ncbi:MAG TPA: multicopper oxidase family protein [Gemmatimonadetes bacterium]|nr:multicopper oxidase family protein [Gemmatimonadota bacterium]
MFNLQRRTFMALLLATASPVGTLAQVPGVSPLCADRPPVTGSQLSIRPPSERPSRAGTRPDRPASDLLCIDLFSTANGRDASGVIELTRPWSPFGVTVTPQGHHRQQLKAWISGLPELSTLGPYRAYIAWATPLELDPVIKLGVVSDGENELGEVAFNKFMVLITAEPSLEVDQRSGPLILRGRSPSSRMEAHDLMALAPAAEAGVVTTSLTENVWDLPPMYEGVPMLPGVMATRPRSSPLLPTDTADIPRALPSEVVELPDGGTLDLFAGFVRREIQGRELTMLAFNNQHPGPLIKVEKDATIFVNFTNETSLPTAVHWHGVRLENRYDGVPGLTQEAVEPGQTFRYQIYFKDAGIYWYHPHHREDVQQELGLAGNILVTPISTDYYSPVNREEVVMLDDFVLTQDGTVPFGLESSNYMLMGRFGNLFITNGEPEYSLETNAGEVVRFHFTNASNTRTFNISFRPRTEPDANVVPIKVVGSDVGKLEHEVIVESIVLAPAERYVVEVFFDKAGSYELTNHVQGINHRMGVFLEEISILGTITVSESQTAVDHHQAFETLRTNLDVIADIDRYRSHFDRPVDHELVLTLEVDSLPPAIEQSMLYDWVYFNPVEWTGTMPVMNWSTTGAEVEWILRDAVTGDENTEVNWSFQVGDVVKIRIHNDRGAFHSMQHPLHIHGQRFLILEQNGVANNNLVWKDTVLLPVGSSTDILLELSNPGRWMVHCHIAEHLESGMKFVIDVEGN